MKYRTLIKAAFRQHKGSLIGIFILIFFISLALTTILTLWINSNKYIQSELKRSDYGDITAWVSDVPNLKEFINNISNFEDIERVETQNIVYSDYIINNQESDSEGQLITFVPNENRYKFFTDDLSDYRQDIISNIDSGHIYISPSLVSMFHVEIGDKITFPIAREGGNFVFTVKGYYEDPFMGSSMIGMKGFLIGEEDREKILKIIQTSGYNALARNGAMLHIFKENDSLITISDLNSKMNNNAGLSEYSEFVHSETTISGFMLILQNAFSGLILAFVVVLLFVALVVVGHSLSNAIETDFVNMGILKTIGLTSKDLRQVQLIQYLISVFSGMILGLCISIPVADFVSRMTVTTTGILYPTELPLGWWLLSFVLIHVLLIGYVWLKTVRIDKISPLKVIKGDQNMFYFLL